MHHTLDSSQAQTDTQSQRQRPRRRTHDPILGVTANNVILSSILVRRLRGLHWTLLVVRHGNHWHDLKVCHHVLLRAAQGLVTAPPSWWQTCQVRSGALIFDLSVSALTESAALPGRPARRLATCGQSRPRALAAFPCAF